MNEKDLTQDSINEFCENLMNYKFKDNLGHPIKNCIDFRQLMKKALEYELYYLKTEKIFHMSLSKKNLIDKKIKKIEGFLQEF